MTVDQLILIIIGALVVAIVIAAAPRIFLKLIGSDTTVYRSDNTKKRR